MEPALDIRSAMDTEAAAAPAVVDGDSVRANTYGLLGALLAGPPRQEIFDLLAGIDPPSADGLAADGLATDGLATDGLGRVWRELATAAERADVEAADDEYHDLFIGVGRGELIPYGSWYRTGFVMDKPLAALRSDLAALGFERLDEVKEPEDHAAALLETMGLIAASPEHGLEVQRRFFDRHVATWMPTFFADLQTAASARFYRAVGRFGEQFIRFEMQYLSIVV